MTNDPRPLNRFHFLRFVPKAVFNNWHAKRAFTLALLAIGAWAGSVSVEFRFHENSSRQY